VEESLASRLSGLLYGNILHRNSDDEGYRFHFETLQKDRAALVTLVVKFFVSEEFVEKFVVNQTPNELVRNLLNSFFGPDVVTPLDVSTWRDRLVHKGFDAVVTGLINEPRFIDKHGPTGVPRYTERRAGAPQRPGAN